MRIVVGFPPGGGADVYSRLIARHLGRFIPGNPTLAVSNMPGAGSIIAGNHIFNSGAKDGTEIGMLNGAAILEQLFESSGVHFDMAKFRYLAVPVNETYVMIVARQSGITKFSEVIGPNAKQTIIGAIPNSTLEHAPALLRDAPEREHENRFRLQGQRRYPFGDRRRRDRRIFQSLEHDQAHSFGQVQVGRMAGARSVD